MVAPLQVKRSLCGPHQDWRINMKNGFPDERRSHDDVEQAELTKLRAAPERRAEVPPCAPAGQMNGGTASQELIRVLGRP